MLKVIYAGNPECSAKTLRALTYASQKSEAFEIVGVITNPPSKKVVIRLKLIHQSDRQQKNWD